MAISTVNNPDSKIGDLNNLTTSDKSNVVGAVNELNSKIPTLKQILGNVTLKGNDGNTWHYSGQSFTITKPCFVILQGWFSWAPCYGIGITHEVSSSYANELSIRQEDPSITFQAVTALLTAVGTYYIWVKSPGNCNGSVYLYEF